MKDKKVSAASHCATASDIRTYSPHLSVGSERLRGPSGETFLDEQVTERSTLADVSYDRQRASEERTAALQSRDVRVRRVHVELADRYEERVGQSLSESRSQLWL